MREGVGGRESILEEFKALYVFIKDPLAQQRTEKLCFINAIHSSLIPPLDPRHLKWHLKIQKSITSTLLKRKKCFGTVRPTLKLTLQE